MSVRRQERFIAPMAQTDLYMQRRHGVKTRRQMTLGQQAATKRPPATVVSIGDGSVVVGANVRKIHLDGAGVSVAVVGDVATVTIP